jgi:pimeloyl-ACP methyl ester carboxylesterase/DNA-binding CsgD family transcriptional regulator
MQQDIGFTRTSDGVRIAYASVGSGPVIVKAPNWLTHLEFEWETPVWRHWWEELAKDFRVIRFDQRGSGLSDWNVEKVSFEAWVEDLETVVDATGVERFALLGISQGGPTAIEYAVRHPERVSHLLLVGAYGRGWVKRGQSLEEHRALMTLTREGWGRANPTYRRLFTSSFMPGATEEQMTWFDELQRVSTSPENAARMRGVSGEIDVLDRLKLVSAPTLILHAKGELRVPFEESRLLASLIPNARLVELDSRNHLPIEDEPAWQVLVSEVRAFLGAVERPTTQEPPVLKAPALNALTARELEVLRLLAQGKSNQEIAEELVISFNTVTNHVKSILSKTGSANRTEAGAYAFRNGLLEEPIRK